MEKLNTACAGERKLDDDFCDQSRETELTALPTTSQRPNPARKNANGDDKKPKTASRCTAGKPKQLMAPNGVNTVVSSGY